MAFVFPSSSSSCRLHLDETAETGILDSKALPLLAALTSEVGDALGEIAILLEATRHPARSLRELAWRPDGLLHARRALLRSGLRSALLENLFVMKAEVMATRQIIAFSNLIFSLSKISFTVELLWRDAYTLATSARRKTLLFQRSGACRDED